MNDLRFAVRQLFKNPGFAALAILTLALGIGANTAMFSLVNGVLLKPLPFKDSDRLVALFQNHREQGQDFVELTAPDFVNWRDQNRAFEDLAAYQAGGFDLTGAGDPVRVFGVRASASFFPLLGVRPEFGRAFVPEEDVFGKGRVVILGQRLWKERFQGSPEVIGKSITLDGNSYSVIGVMPAGFRFAGIDADVWRPMAFEDWEMDNRGGHNYQAVGRLKAGMSLLQAKAEMDTIAANLSKQFELSRGWGATLTSLQEQLVGSSARPLYILFGAVGFVLLIASGNVANLLLARASTRAREFAIRGAIGAGRKAIVRQLVLESFVLAGAGAFAGWLLANWAMGVIARLGAAGLPRLEEVRLDGYAAAFAILVTFLTALVFGLAPAWFASKVNLVEVLKETARGSMSGQTRRVQSGFVAAQLALALVLLIGATLMLRSFGRIRALDTGYEPENILTATLTMPDARFPGKSVEEREPGRRAFLANVVAKVASIPGVESAASVLGMPLTAISARMQVGVLGRGDGKESDTQVAGYSQVSPAYFRTMGISLLKGRQFDSHDTVDAPYVAIVNESFAKVFFPGQDAIGKRLRVMDGHRGKPTEIVGIVRDTRQRSLVGAPEPEMYLPTMQRCWFTGQLVIKTKGDPASMIPAVTKAVAELDSQQTLYFIRTLSSLMEESVSRQRFQMVLLFVFSIVALMLAVIGIYGVTACTVVRRYHEIGVRMSLGAQRRQILGLVLGQGMRPAFAGLIFGLIAAFALARLLQGLLFEIKASDPLTFSIVPGLLLMAAFAGCWLPVRRALKISPAVALRNE